MKLLQLTLLFSMLVVTILAFGFPQFRTYILQTISLLAVFSIILHQLEIRNQEKEREIARQHEELALFLSTEVKPVISDTKQLLERNKKTEALQNLELLQNKLSSMVKEMKS